MWREQHYGKSAAQPRRMRMKAGAGGTERGDGKHFERREEDVEVKDEKTSLG